MKQIINDCQTKSHLPAKIQLADSITLKPISSETMNGGDSPYDQSAANLIFTSLPDENKDLSNKTEQITNESVYKQIDQHQLNLTLNGDQSKNGNSHIRNSPTKSSLVSVLSNDGPNAKVIQMTYDNKNFPNGSLDATKKEDNGNVMPISEKNVPEGDPKKQKWGNLKRLLAGVSLTILSAFVFSITTVIVKLVTDIKPSQMALFRYIGIMILAFPVVLESGHSFLGDGSLIWFFWMILRGVSGCTSLFFRYSAVTYISLANTTIIMLSMPVFVFIFARIFLKEQFGRFHALALVMSIVGISFASKIEVLFGKNSDFSNSTTLTHGHNETHHYQNSTLIDEEEEDSTTKTNDQLIGSLFACGAMCIGSLVYITVRKMRKTHHSVILFNFGVIAVIEMTIVNWTFYDFKLPTTGYSAYLITILAVLSFYGQLLLTKAIQLEEAGVVSVVRVSGEAFFAFVFQVIIFGEMPDIYTIIGAILVLSSVFLLSFRKYVISLPDESNIKRKFYFITK